VLLIALVILLMVTLMGVSAIKSGLFHERMAFNSQAEELSFQAAETAIGGVITEAISNGALLTSMMQHKGTDVVHCFTRSHGLQEAACGADDTLDERESLQAQASSHYDLKRPLLGTDAAAFMDYQFATEGYGHYVDASLPFANRNYQEWRKLGPGAGQFSDEAGLLAY